MKSLALFAAAALASPAQAQDHAGHMPAPAPVEQPDHAQMDHAQMDHGAMGQMCLFSHCPFAIATRPGYLCSLC